MRSNQSFKSLLYIFIFFSQSFSYLSAQCETDTLPPFVYTVNVSSAILDTSCYEVKLYARDFFIIAQDDCTPTDSMRFTFDGAKPEFDESYEEEYRSSSKSFNCLAVENSPVQITVTAWDLSKNNVSSTIPTTFVPSSGGECPSCIDDTTPPEATFLPEIVWLASTTSPVTEIWASDFVIDGFDFCTLKDSLKYSFSTDPDDDVAYFNCIDLIDGPNEYTLNVYVWDQSGNYIAESVTVNIQLPIDFDCPPDGLVVSGSVLDQIGNPIIGATVLLTDHINNTEETSTTNDMGVYTFLSVSDLANKSVSISYEDNSIPDVDVVDFLALQKHLLGLQSLNNAQMLAADFNADNKLKTKDLFIFKEYLLEDPSMIETLDQSWHFILDSDEEELINSVPLSENPNPSFIGYRLGDIK